MKIISLNIWYGILFEPLMQFIKEASTTTDVFCFQEVLQGPDGHAFFEHVRTNIYADLERALPEFQGYFESTQGISAEETGFSGHVSMGVSIFVRRAYTVESVRGFFAWGKWEVFDWKDDKSPGFVQYSTFRVPSRELYTILNVHGISEWPKVDTPARVLQSKRIVEFLEKAPGRKIVCGDFNLFPDTESVAMLSRGMRDLTAEFGILGTRSRTHWKKKSLNLGGFKETVSDYCFISPEINVLSFSVPEVDISDHLPLVLEIAD